MNTIKSFFTLLLLTAPLLIFGQTYNLDSIITPAQKTPEHGKSHDGKPKNKLTGFTWRISTGYFSQIFDKNGGYYPAAVVPYSFEFGYRLKVLEAGYRHFNTGPGLGTDFAYSTGVFINPNVVASYRLPVLTGLVADMATLKIHIPVKKVPVALHIGAGRTVFKYSDNFVAQDFYDDGRIIYNDYSVLVVNSPLIKSFAATAGLTLSKGPFFCGIEWWYLRGKKDALGLRYTNRMQHMQVGIQMNTSQKRDKFRIKSNEPLKRKRVAVGISSLASITPFKKYSGTGSGITADASVNLGKRTAILVSFQIKSSLHGFNKEPNGFYNYIKSNGGYNAAGQIGRHLLLAGTLLNPRNEFQVYAYYGGGYYYATQTNPDFSGDPFIDPFYYRPFGVNLFKRSVGIAVGGGIQYKYLHSQLLLHNTFSSYPAILEWNLGGRILF